MVKSEIIGMETEHDGTHTGELNVKMIEAITANKTRKLLDPIYKVLVWKNTDLVKSLHALFSSYAGFKYLTFKRLIYIDSPVPRYNEIMMWKQNPGIIIDGNENRQVSIVPCKGGQILPEIFMERRGIFSINNQKALEVFEKKTSIDDIIKPYLQCQICGQETTEENVNPCGMCMIPMCPNCFELSKTIGDVKFCANCHSALDKLRS